MSGRSFALFSYVYWTIWHAVLQLRSNDLGLHDLYHLLLYRYL